MPFAEVQALQNPVTHRLTVPTRCVDDQNLAKQFKIYLSLLLEVRMLYHHLKTQEANPPINGEPKVDMPQYGKPHCSGLVRSQDTYTNHKSENTNCKTIHGLCLPLPITKIKNIVLPIKM